MLFQCLNTFDYKMYQNLLFNIQPLSKEYLNLMAENAIMFLKYIGKFLYDFLNIIALHFLAR